MNRIRSLSMVLCSLLFLPLRGNTGEPAPVSAALRGVWENENRFVEFTENNMRIVLKPYYRFVYESFPPLSCFSNPRSQRVAADNIHSLSLRYPRDKKVYPFTAARIGDALFLDFMVRLSIPDADPVARAELTESAGNAAAEAQSAAGTEPAGGLDGVWLPAGAVPALRLYPVEPAKDFYMMVFDGSRYFRIRYWKTDARERDVDGRFIGKDGKEYRLPKFFRMDGALYTCITATGKIIRNFEEGRIRVEDGTLRFEPERVVYAGTEAAYRQPVPYTLDGDVLAFGEPYLVRSVVTDLDAAIAEHNAKRRPPRKPIFDFLDLDFHWDEVARLRGDILDR